MTKRPSKPWLGPAILCVAAMAEAVALVQDLSTDESAAFVNGLLARISEIKSRLVRDPIPVKPEG